MDAFKTLGQRIGEAAFLGDNTGRLPGADTLSRDQALDRKATLMKDQSWAQKWDQGDAAAVKEMSDLDRIITTRPR